MQANTRQRGPVRSSAPGLALLLALPIAICFGTTADAQSSPGPLCCDSGTGLCRNLSVDGGAVATPPPKPDSLGVPTQCPLPSPSGNAVTIEIAGAAAKAGAKLVVDTTEPYEGFWGACLAQHISYSPQLPAVCYRVKVTGSVTGVTPVGEHPYSVVTAPAAGELPGAGKVFQPYSTADIATANPDSYQVLMTCRLPDPTKAPGSSSSSHCSNLDGCCDFPDALGQSMRCCNGCCPPWRSVSHSCCDLGAHLTSLDGKYARGFASMPTFQ